METGRTAIMLSECDTYKYTPEDMLNIRSLIMEAGRSSSVTYVVYHLVRIRETAYEIYNSEANYTAALEKVVPRELCSMAVLSGTLVPQSGNARTQPLDLPAVAAVLALLARV
jgi:hypothetical protein